MCATFTNQAKNSASFTNQSKNSATWTNQSKNLATFDNLSKHSGTLWYILQEIGDFVLLEDGGFLIGAGGETSFSNLSKISSSWSNLPKS